MRPKLAFFSLLALSACRATGASSQSPEHDRSTHEALDTTGEYFYLQCNSTAWDTSSTTLMTMTAPGVYSLTYNVSINYPDQCDLFQTSSPPPHGYDTTAHYFGFTAQQVLIMASSTTTLTALPTGTSNQFKVSYPGTGTFTATFNANDLTLTFASGNGSTSSSTSSSSSSSSNVGSLTNLSRVLLLSVDGLHAIDLYNWVAASPRSAIANLYSHGVEYANAQATTPSNGFPAMLALATGGTPLSTGVYGDDSYDRYLYPPGSQCQGTSGTEVVYTGAIDEDETQLLGAINPANLPLSVNSSTGECNPVLPHQFLQTNTIFELVEASGGQTAWADSHPSYEILNGPSGTGVSDLYTPEVSSLTSNGGTVNGVALGATLSACDGTTNSAPTVTDYTTCVPAAMAYDDVKVQAVINQIDGLRSDGSASAPVPALFGMNFEAVGVAQTLGVGGYLDPLATPSAQLGAALSHVNASLGRIMAELDAKGLTNSTLVILTAKHGQAPIDRTLVNLFPHNMSGQGLTSPLSFVQQAVPTVDSVFAPFVNPNTQSASVAVGGHLQLGGDVGILWLQPSDENNFNIATIVSDLSDPENALLIGATTPPPGAIFLNSVTSGSDLAAVYGDPLSTDQLAVSRAPNVLIQPDLGNIYTIDGSRIAGHGGGSLDDTNVPLLLSHPQIVQTSVFDPVQTTQVAVTILHALRIDMNPALQLSAAQAEGTMVLPSLPF
ncbi:MAG: alkaline phosphatase family protein [Polyangiaceae bacterium]|nr:alkaline phosphatase family protein [Polyangiaceae bacterium]